MSSAYDYVQKLSHGIEPEVSFRMSWGLHEGLRGATWTILSSDGTVLRNIVKPARDPAGPQRPTEIGRISMNEVQALAAIFCAQRFDLIQVPLVQATLIGGPEVEFAVSIPNERFSLRCPNAQLSSVYGLSEIGRVFAELRQRFEAS